MSRTVYLVDDDEAVRHALSIFLESQGLDVVKFDCAESFLSTVADFHEGVLVLDIRMREMSGLDLQAKLNNSGLKIPIVFISGHGDVRTSVKAMKAGAITFLEKPFRNSELLNAVMEAFEVHDTSIKSKTQQMKILTRYKKLSRREKEVMGLVTEGRTNKEISGLLNISVRTVEVHRSNVMDKMKAESLPRLVRLAEYCSTDIKTR